MKKLIALVAIFVLASFLAGALFSRASIQANTQDQFSEDYGNAQPTNAASTGSDGSGVDACSAQSVQAGSPTSSAGQASVPEDDSGLRCGCDPDTPVTNGVPPPDGAIFYGGEPPYAYIPTYNPKETGLPILPLEPES